MPVVIACWLRVHSAEVTTVGELRGEPAQIGPIVTDSIERLYPEASPSTPAYRCWVKDAASTLVEYSVGPLGEYSKICKTTVAEVDVPPAAARGPIC